MEDFHKKFKTWTLLLIWIGVGFFNEIGGPTMIDLKLRFQSSYTSISWAISAAGLGRFTGAFIGGVLVDVLEPWRDMYVAVSQLLAVAMVMAMPFVANVGTLWFMFFAMGTAVGVVTVVTHRILIKMWREKTPAPMQVVHLGTGIGATLAPLVANNFLARLKFQDPPGNSTAALPPDQQEYTVVQESRVHLAFVTIGVIVLSLSTPFAFYSFYKNHKFLRSGDSDSTDDLEEEQSKSVKEALRALVDPGTYSDYSRGFVFFFCVTLIIFFMNLVGGEHTLGKFIRTYSVDAAHFSRDKASYLDMAYWGSFTVGRCVSSVMAYYLSTQKLLLVAALFNTAMGILFALFTARSHASLWACTVLSGISFSPLSPAGISFTNTYLEMKGAILTLIEFSSGFGNMIYMGVTGSLYDIYGPQALLYVVAFCCSLTTVVALVFTCGTYKRADRFSKVLSEDTELIAKGSESDDGHKPD